MTGIRLHIGEQERREGWMILDPVARPETDHVGSAADLSFLAYESISEIYGSHVLGHLGYDGELQAALAGFAPIRRVQEFGGFANDGSSYRFLSVPVSCNIEAFKRAAYV